MRSIWALIKLDLTVWRRTPWVIFAAIIPPIGMFILIWVLSLAVTEQPVALVMNSHGPQAQAVAKFIRADSESYQLKEVDAKKADQMLDSQKVAAIIEIPKNFDEDIAKGRAQLNYTLNNINIDFGDDIRRSVDRSVAQYDAPQLGSAAADERTGASLVVPNPYRVDINETDLRDTEVAFEDYQTIPVLLLLIISTTIIGGAFLNTRDHERKTDRFISTTPLGRVQYVAGRVLGTVCCSLTVVVPAVLLLWWYGTLNPPSGHWPPLLAVFIETLILSAGLGVLLGIVFKRTATVALAAITAASYLFFLGGGFTTIAFLPKWLRDISRIVPTRYAIDGMRTALFYAELKDMAYNLIMLGVFAVGITAIAVWTLNRQARELT